MINLLEEREFDRLLAAVLGEQKRRGPKPATADENSRKQRTDAVAMPLTISKVNAVRAAFKAGISPARIARQFGLSHADVRKALASNMLK